MALLRRKRARLRPLSETEAYARCHGDRADDVKVVSMERARRPRFQTTVSGERLRSLFEQRLDAREVEAEATREGEDDAQPESEAPPESEATAGAAASEAVDE